MKLEWTRLLLLVAVFFLAVATWLNDVAVADMIFIFAAFAIGGVWSKYGEAGLEGHDQA